MTEGAVRYVLSIQTLTISLPATIVQRPLITVYRPRPPQDTQYQRQKSKEPTLIQLPH